MKEKSYKSKANAKLNEIENYSRSIVDSFQANVDTYQKLKSTLENFYNSKSNYYINKSKDSVMQCTVQYMNTEGTFTQKFNLICVGKELSQIDTKILRSMDSVKDWPATSYNEQFHENMIKNGLKENSNAIPSEGDFLYEAVEPKGKEISKSVKEQAKTYYQSYIECKNNIKALDSYIKKAGILIATIEQILIKIDNVANTKITKINNKLSNQELTSSNFNMPEELKKIKTVAECLNSFHKQLKNVATKYNNCKDNFSAGLR